MGGLSGAAMAPTSDPGPMLDAEAKESYRQRLAEIEDELAQATSWHDDERAARLAGERDLIAGELGRAVGLGQRDRSFASPEERARVSVTKAIKTAIRLIDQHSPELAAHLDASIQTGRFCAYSTQGAPPPSWSL